MSTKDYVRDLRRLVGHAPVNFVGAAGLICNAAGEVLLQRRRGSERWGLVAGIAELGEPLEQTLRREVQEELGLTVQAAEFLELLNPAGLSRVANGDEFYSYTALYRVTAWTGIPVPDGVEIAEARFFSLAEFPPLTRLGQRAKEVMSSPASMAAW
ncbi:NUDIX domain-containing protein [Deinococcus radiodurans]|jgi:ADP-ribose pyrophosphatase|uniref:MutT/nudix family protein n=1 Tax=Deinococcus radiodurans (strain ATCC 13939 / DSM 20539 / JCM 16871 / CCUG 27074 / LMG 4051 / NBRC 15346 / NCIMB 9279 / VKM B-1422 / R1) TaxID=243230 RepID=Q9RW85_DEIRA|nr:NUDIX domain-containing protein [Deinococcus radiodurans]AAF10362.1 MutT/nudix family protein [Deinococcus radiodurans R1 = ATCC 13939 = DSM 20539]ANC71998.1 DNA mismatch repair protein MutT [Deinococcus radiodurans R1 = ATCC 13939 = DSM 20539]QEM72718.1 NUDIX domain-containing protein [Deinococcus radiodurans]QIP28914.1 NUDIX domain-containing protein [Deinococcus radiodurans]QIP32377.1 NUDIX domain-containing protein [Deinococcus radiodurans]